MFKKNGGFTLVELIVVIAILAILAGIGVPAYSSYISKATGSVEDASEHIADVKSELVEINSAAQWNDIDADALD